MFLILLQGLMNKLGILVLFAFILSRSNVFQRYVLKEQIDWKEKIFSSIVFGGVGILGTYWGIEVQGGIANSRSIGVLIGGMLGGPVVGIGAGLIAGIHRMLLPVGELTALACGISTVIGGIIGGLFKKYIEERENKWAYGVLMGFAVEIVQMCIILLIARPFDQATQLVQLIFLPMTLINAIGVGIVFALISEIYVEHENAAARKAQLALEIATKTIPYLRKGLGRESAVMTSQIIYDATNMDAVSITDCHTILAHVGVGADHHEAGSSIYTDLTKKVVENGRYMIAQQKHSIACPNPKCMLKSVVAVPLKIQDKTIGVLKLYRSKENSITSSDIELVKGLGHLFSNQIELSQLEYQKELLSRAELKTLQAQIHPHFLFNALNTIVSFCRKDPSRARELLLELSVYLRSSFKNPGAFVSLEQEIQTIKAYLSIEQARFPKRLEVNYDIEQGLHCKIPPLILQPIVENAVKHGLFKKKEGGILKISVYKEQSSIKICVKDTGVGMSKEMVYDLLNKKNEVQGIGVSNVNQRLKSIYNTILQIESIENEGTTVIIRIPLKEVGNKC